MFPGVKVDTADVASETTDDRTDKPQNNQVVIVRVPVKHANLGIRSHAMDMSTMVELTSFSTLGKIQPFLVTISTTAALIVDLHCHLTDKEVCGYLGGHWDINAHNLAITSAFPCRYAGKDKTAAGMVEAEIARAMEWQRVTLVGWYHSHPRSHASPSLRDVDYQLDYQIKMKGPSDNGYTPCVGLICSPYNADGNCYESNFNVYWSMPPPENRPHEYPRPMLLSYTISQELFLPQDALDEIKKCIEYYRSEGGIDFKTNFNSTTTYMERLRNSLASKLPGRSRGNDTGYWEVIREMILPGSKEDKMSSSDAFIAVQFPPIGLAESLGQNTTGLGPNNIFLAPVNFKPDTNIVSSATKSFTQPSTSARDCKKDNQDDMIMDGRLFGKIERPETLPTFRSGELTVSVKNVKMDFEPTPMDFAKLPNPLSIEAFTKMRSNLSSEFPLADISQHITQLPDLSNFANFSPADLAKLSGFALGDLTKTSSNAYANLFAPLNKSCSGIPTTTKNIVSDRISDFSHSGNDQMQPISIFSTESSKMSEMNDRKKPLSEKTINEVPKLNRPTDFSTAEELSISSVRPDFGAMLDMKTLHGKNLQSITINDPVESLNLSKDRQ